MRPVFSLKSYMLNGNLELACTLGESEEWGGGGYFLICPWCRSLVRQPWSRIYSGGNFDDEQSAGFSRGDGGVVDIVTETSVRASRTEGDHSNQSMDSSVGSCGRHGS